MSVNKEAIKKRHKKEFYKKYNKKGKYLTESSNPPTTLFTNSMTNQSANQTIKSSISQSVNSPINFSKLKKSAQSLSTLKQTENRNTNEDAAHSAVSQSANVLKFTSKQVNHLPGTEVLSYLSNSTSHTPSVIESKSVNFKSNLLSAVSPKTEKNDKRDELKKRQKKRQKQLYQQRKNKSANLFEKRSSESKTNKRKKILSQKWSEKTPAGKLTLAAFSIILIIILVIFTLSLTFFSSSSSDFIDDYLADFKAAYPADENDITRVNVHWQTLIVTMKEQHKKIPETVTEKYDNKKSKVTDIMNDNNSPMAN